MTLTPANKKMIRTLVPTLFGAAVALIAKSGLNLSSDMIVIIMPCITGLYYTTIKSLEKKYPRFSWLLGALPSNPIDPKSAPIDPEEVELTP
jgi:hypothetical protein